MITTELLEEIRERFVRYAQIDTQSAEDAATYPSTGQQLVLLRLLADELRQLGLVDVKLDDYGYVTATLPSNLDRGDPRFATTPTIGLLAHVDTSFSVSGANVRPRIVRYEGGDIVLPADSGQVIRVADYPDLVRCVGHDIVTTDGTTLLGADDKAGVAEIMVAMSYLTRHPELRHGKLRVGFTPDEEVGRGTEHFDVPAFGADYAYTVDGGPVGEIEDETFCADSARVIFQGRNVHPGLAKGKMVNSLKLAADFISRLPREGLSPETTEGREGFVHPDSIEGDVELTAIKLIVRDFTVEGLRAREDHLRSLVGEVVANEPRAKVSIEISESYRNMKVILDQHPRVVACAAEAIRRSGLTPIKRPIRGGTDGARLSFAGLPTPNLFTGGHGFHSKQEWISLQDMGKAVETIVNLAQIWAEPVGNGC